MGEFCERWGYRIVGARGVKDTAKTTHRINYVGSKAFTEIESRTRVPA